MIRTVGDLRSALANYPDDTPLSSVSKERLPAVLLTPQEFNHRFLDKKRKTQAGDNGYRQLIQEEVEQLRSKTKRVHAAFRELRELLRAKQQVENGEVTRLTGLSREDRRKAMWGDKHDLSDDGA